MDVAILGAGNVGSALAGALVRAGHAVTITSTSPDKARSVAEQTGARYAETNTDAAASAGVVVLAMSMDSAMAVVNELGGALDGKIVVDPTNRMDPEDPGAAVDGSSNAEALQSAAPSARVIKALNTVLASRMAEPVVEGLAVDGFVAGDDPEAKAVVLELVGSIGMRPLDSGELRMARVLEALAILNLVLNMRSEWVWQSGWKLIGPTTPEG